MTATFWISAPLLGVYLAATSGGGYPGWLGWALYLAVLFSAACLTWRSFSGPP